MIKKNKLRYFLISILLTLSFYLLYMVISPVWLQISALNTEKMSLLDDIEESKKILQEKNEYDAEIINNKNFEQDAGHKKRIPQKKNLDTVMIELEEIFNNSSVSISGVQFGKIHIEEDNVIGSIPVNIIVTESFNRESAVLKFLEDLADFPYLFSIKSINYNRGIKEIKEAYGQTRMSVAPESEVRLNLNCLLYVSVE